jgi:hypothetical protein
VASWYHKDSPTTLGKHSTTDLREEKSTQANNPFTRHDPDSNLSEMPSSGQGGAVGFYGPQVRANLLGLPAWLTGSKGRRRIPRAYIWNFCVHRKKSEACEKPTFAFPVWAFTDSFPQETNNSGQSKKGGQGGQQGGSGQQGSTAGG